MPVMWLPFLHRSHIAKSIRSCGFFLTLPYYDSDLHISVLPRLPSLGRCTCTSKPSQGIFGPAKLRHKPMKVIHASSSMVLQHAPQCTYPRIRQGAKGMCRNEAATRPAESWLPASLDEPLRRLVTAATQDLSKPEPGNGFA